MAERRTGVLNNAALPFKLRDHALFISFAPSDNPRYALAIVLEHNAHLIRNLDAPAIARDVFTRSEEHTSELQSLMRISYAVFCLKKKNTIKYQQRDI